MRSFSRVSLGAVTASSMAASTFPVIIASVLAAQLINEFTISRAQLGFLVAGSGLVGALASPFFGRLTDRLGAVRSVVGTLTLGAITLTGLAFSPTYMVLVGVFIFSGLPNGWGNPATNALIVDNTSTGVRGFITGVKQSGVQIGTFLGGLALPVFAGWWSWRIAVLIFLLIPLAGLVGMIGRQDAKTHRERAEIDRSARLPVSVRWVTAYGFVSGLASSALLGFLPLFAHEDLRWSEAGAGTLIAIVGFMGVAARILWPHLAERSMGHGRTLRILAWLTTGTALLAWAAGAGLLPGWVLILAALLLGAGAVAWNAVGMLAVMDFSPAGLVGKGTGLVLFGFLFGMALGPPLMGYSVDFLGSYGPGWIATAVLLMMSSIIALKIPSGSTAVGVRMRGKT